MAHEPLGVRTQIFIPIYSKIMENIRYDFAFEQLSWNETCLIGLKFSLITNNSKRK